MKENSVDQTKSQKSCDKGGNDFFDHGFNLNYEKGI
jgi:hypothetical protein